MGILTAVFLLFLALQGLGGKSGLGGKVGAGGGLTTAGAVSIGISNDGKCSATGTSCTLSGTASNDLKIAFAFTASSTTIPTLPGGWTSIASGSTVAGGTTAAYQIACTQSSSSSDTSSGTWTNATAVEAVSYSGTAIGNASNCPATAIGGSASNNAQTSTTITWTAFTMKNGLGPGWTAYFAGDTAGSTCTPSTGLSGFVMRLLTNTGDVTLSDQGGNSNTSPAFTCTVSSSTWMSFALEILRAPCPQNQWCLVQSFTGGAPCGASSSCSLTPPQATSAGNVGIVWFDNNNQQSLTISSISGGGPWGAAPSGCTSVYNACDYNLSLNIGATTITVNFSGALTSTGQIYYAEFSPPAGHTPAFDTSGANSATSCTTCTGPTLTLTGTSPELVTGYIACTNVCLQVSSPFRSPQGITGNVFAGAQTSSGAGIVYTSDGTAGAYFMQALAIK